MARKSKNAVKESFWRDVLRRHAKSGLSVRTFCRQQKLAENSFYWWRRQIAVRDRRNRGRQSQSQPSRTAKREPTIAGFIPVQLTAGGVLELTHPGGCRISVPDGFRAATLQQVLAVLDGARE
jgi:hypothetical protein